MTKFQSHGHESSRETIAPFSWYLDDDQLQQNPGVAELIEEERSTPIEVTKDLSLRAKVLDACGLTCTFCHNEGTPVTVDNAVSEISVRGIAGRSGRISVFAASNGVDFLAGKMDPDDVSFGRSLGSLREHLGLNELHLTGGEPTLHPKLPDVIKVARDEGYSVSMTSNGERGSSHMQEAAENGLNKVNFSIFGTTPEELAEVQHDRYKDVALAERKLNSLRESIESAANAGLTVAANLVMSGPHHGDRVQRLISEFDPRLDLRILPDLSHTQESAVAIYALLSEMGARPYVTQVEAGSSNARVRYVLPGGRNLAFKQIRPTRLDECSTCELNNPQDCMEGFYGTRLYVDTQGNYKVGVCLQRMDLTENIDDFLASGLSEQVVSLREREYEYMKGAFKANGR